MAPTTLFLPHWLRALPGTGVLFGIRTALTALAALWLAMWLQLETPRWAAWTVMSLALPTRGQVGVKGLWRMAGTVVGLVAALVAVALFAQHPIMMGVWLALWCGLNSYVGGRTPGLASYGTSLASLTAALIVLLSEQAPLQTFATALARGAGIMLGIGCVYIASAAAELVEGPRPGPAFPAGPSPSRDEVLAAAVRAVIVVLAAWALWVATAWPSGAFFVVIAAVTSTIFATMPDADIRARGYLYGVAVGQIAGLLVRYGALTAPGSFGLLAAIVFPFLFIGAVGMTDPRSIAPALGFNLSFLIAAEPLNPMTYDVAGSLNEAVAIFCGIAFGRAAYRTVLPGHVWRLARP